MQIVLFALIPFIWWLVTAKKEISFAQWIGMKKVERENRKDAAKMIVCTTIAFVLLSVFILYMLKGTETATADFRGKGAAAFPAAFIYAFFNTAFPEEILFRGFLLKRLKNKFGFGIANVMQSILFGVLHGVMFFSLVGIIKTLIVIVFTGAIAWLMGYANEEKANGSILPSWIMHGIANTVSAMVSMFSII